MNIIKGIGIDDMFIIYSAFKRTNNKMETKHRISIALGKIGTSISITSLTNFVAFIVGVLTDFKSVQIFCVYAG